MWCHMSSQDELRALGHEKRPLLKAVRAKCLDCSGGSRVEVRDCPITKCDLYPFRLGKNLWRPDPSEAVREVRRRNAGKTNERAKIAS
jgi:hypothetical protein